MGMLTKEDLRQIGEVVDQRLDQKLDEKLDAKLKVFKREVVTEVAENVVSQVVPQVVSQVVEQVGEMIEQNVLPQFDRLENVLVTKDYLDDKIADLRGEFVLKNRRMLRS